MNIEFEWNEKNYKNLLYYLHKIADEKHKKFSSKIIKDETLCCLGIKMSTLRKIASEICLKEPENFLEMKPGNLHEERMIHGLVILLGKFKYKKFMFKLNSFIPYISNWALSDIFATKIKVIEQNKNEAFDDICIILRSKEPFATRLALVIILGNFVNRDYIEKIFDICKNLERYSQPNNSNNAIFYAEMAAAWLISVCYIKFPTITENFMREKKLNKIIHNKAIQKIKESNRIDKETKLKINSLKI